MSEASGPPASHERPIPGTLEEAIVTDAIVEPDPAGTSSETALIALEPKQQAITEIDRATVDVQVATAKKFPRVMTDVLRTARTLATMDQKTAATMSYAVKRGGKLLEGPSVRLAEVIAHSWGNLRVDTAIVAEDARSLTAAGTCFDLEKNVAVRSTVRRSIVGRNGRYNEDMITTTANAASSIAFRNAIFKVVPRALVMGIYEAARKASRGEGTIEELRKAMLAWFGSKGVKPEQVYQLLEVKGIDDVGEEEILTLRSLANAIKDGEQKVENLFGPDTEPSVELDKLNESLRRKRDGSAAGGEAAPPAAPAAAAAAPGKCKICFRTDGTHDPNAPCGKQAAAAAGKRPLNPLHPTGGEIPARPRTPAPATQGSLDMSDADIVRQDAENERRRRGEE